MQPNEELLQGIQRGEKATYSSMSWAHMSLSRNLMFHQRLKELEEFKAEFGHCNVPGPTITNKYNSLAGWSYQSGDLTRHSKREENHLVRQWDRFMKWTKMNLPLSASIALSLISVIPSIQSKDVGCCLYRPKLKMVVPKNHSYCDSNTQATWSVSRTR